MKKNIIMASTIALGLGIGSAQAVTITWQDNANPLATFPGTARYANGIIDPYVTGFSAGNEFRIIAFDGSVPVNREKDAIVGGEQWVFDDITGELVGVNNTGTTPGAGGGAAVNGDVALVQNANFFAIPFGFLAPTVGSAAGNAYGVASISSTVNGFDILFPVIEAQWGGAWFTLGSATGGITFNCGVAGTDITCTAEHQIQASEDLASAGFSGFVPQWELHGTIDTTVVPIPSAVWLFASGLLCMTNIARKKKVM